MDGGACPLSTCLPYDRHKWGDHTSSYRRYRRYTSHGNSLYCQFPQIEVRYFQIITFFENAKRGVVGISGRYKRSREGYRTFVLHPPPQDLPLSGAVTRAVDEATHMLGQVETCHMLLPHADLLIYGSLRREALASSTIEGKIASPDELIHYQVYRQAARQDVREVANYVAAIEWGCEQLAHGHPLMLDLMRGLHGRLMHDIRCIGATGQLKDRQNHIGPPGESIERATFVPPPPEDTPALMATLERYIGEENRDPRVVQCAIAHYQFESIHPFNDGNGRVGRLLIILQLMQVGLLSAPLVDPSVYFERTRDAYYGQLQSVRDRGTWDAWIGFFAEGIKQQCAETIALARTLLSLREQIRKEIGPVRRRATLSAVVDVFFREPVLTVSDIAKHAAMAYNSAQSALIDLQERGLVREITGKQKGRAYGCKPVLDVVFGRTTRDEYAHRLSR